MMKIKINKPAIYSSEEIEEHFLCAKGKSNNPTEVQIFVDSRMSVQVRD